MFSINKEEHKEHLEDVFNVLKRHKLYAKRSKCQFFRTRLNTLNMCCLKKVFQLILKRLRPWLGGPSQMIRLRSNVFLGLATYIKKYVRSFSKIEAFMTDLLIGKYERTFELVVIMEVLRL